MPEKIFNLYLFSNDDIIFQLGAKVYSVDGTDDEKVHYLKTVADKELESIKHFDIPDNYQLLIDGEKRTKIIRTKMYQEISKIGKVIDIFSEVLVHYNAPQNPLCCISHIVNGQFKKDGEETLVNNQKDYSLIHFYEQDNFFDKYTREGVFHVLELIEDDFYSPIDLLAQNEYLIPAAKLLFSSIDSFAFLKFGDTNEIFIKWIDTYMSLSEIHVNASELWELRNSLLHMTNYDSRKNISGVITRLEIVSGHDISLYANNNNLQKYLNFDIFYNKVKEAILNWLKDVTNSKEEKSIFISRYKLIPSDFRRSVLMAL